MKKILIAFFTMLFANSIHAQITLQPGIPAVGMMQKNQLWNVLVVNSSSKNYDCRLELVLRDRQTGQEVMTATTGLFTLAPGAKQLNVNTLNPIQYNYLANGIDSRLQGLIPAGVYITCYALTSVAVKDANLAEECISFDVEPLSPPMLIFPADSSILENAPTQFSWIPPTPAGMFDKLHYEILIAEIKEGQKADEAIQENLPFFIDGMLYNNMMNYPGSATSFEKDKWYAWQVVARDDKSYAGKTETWVFKISENRIEKIIKGTPFVKMKTDGSDMAIAPNGYLKIAYDNRYSDSTVKIEIADLSDKGSSGRLPSFTAAVKPGENLIQYNLKKIMHYSEDKTYQAMLTNSKGEKWSVLFRVKIFKN